MNARHYDCGPLAYDKSLLRRRVLVTTFPDELPKPIAVRLVKLALSLRPEFRRIYWGKRYYLAVSFTPHFQADRRRHGQSSNAAAEHMTMARLSFGPQDNFPIAHLIPLDVTCLRPHHPTLPLARRYIASLLSCLCHEFSHALDSYHGRPLTCYRRRHDCRPHEARANRIAASCLLTLLYDRSARVRFNNAADAWLRSVGRKPPTQRRLP
jgi:hypothetical protein